MSPDRGDLVQRAEHMSTLTTACPTWCSDHDGDDDDEYQVCGTIDRQAVTFPKMESPSATPPMGASRMVVRDAEDPAFVALSRYAFDDGEVHPTLVVLDLRSGTAMTTGETRALARALLEAADQADAG